ncbi:unnamed protein product [Caenorhabditis nigoni]
MIGSKEFVIKHVFKNFNNLTLYKFHWSPVQTHYGVEWQIGCVLNSAYVKIGLKKLKSNLLFNMDTEIIQTILMPNGESRKITKSYRFLQCAEDVVWVFGARSQRKDFLKVKDLNITCQVVIKNFFEKLISFDESVVEFSDVVLMVDGEKFHLNKKFLAYHSSYFNCLLFGNFSESEKSIIELKDIDKDAFQNFLELIYGEALVNDQTVDGILNLANFFDSKTANRRCEEFLINRSELEFTEKFKLAVKYKLEKLKKICLPKLTTVQDIRSVIPEDLTEFDVSVWNVLLLKALDL